MANIPNDLKYTKSHEWIRLEDRKAVIGITDHAQHELTDIVFVELPEEGKRIEAGEVALVVESVKIAADIYAPVSGSITRVNRELESHPEWINQDPYGKGWIVEIQTDRPGEDLLDAAAYGSLIG